MHLRVVGAGVFGAAAALELATRGHRVELVDPGPLPHPDAASTDLSKLIRMDYGSDLLYTEWMEAALAGWDAWNARFERPLFHADGIAVLTPALAPGSFEGDSWELLRHRGHPLERLDASRLAHELPEWRGYPDGYTNARAGWAESGAVVRELVRWALDAGVRHRAEAVRDLDALARGCDQVVVAAGAWLASLLPELSDRVRSVGQPVLHFRPAEPERWAAPRFRPWAADIGNTGWYGFPANQDGIVKVANHGPGIGVEPEGPRVVEPGWEATFRAFFREHLPGLEDAPLVGSRLCLYADSFDGDFWIARHPDREGVVIAGGGSGHGFKFAPVLGGWIADVVEGRGAPARFGWRERGVRHTEAARYDG